LLWLLPIASLDPDQACGRKNTEPAAGILIQVNANRRKALNMAPETRHTPMSSKSETVRYGIVSGAAGGLAEIAWVTLYAGVTGGDGAVLARGVTSAAGVSALLPSSPVVLGIIVHMSLAVMLGLLLAFAWRQLREQWPSLRSPYPLALAALAGVWVLNFFIVLPIVSPAFVHLVPYLVSLTSKLLFGIAASATLQWQTASKFDRRQSIPNTARWTLRQ
jgi:hypothetical protein